MSGGELKLTSGQLLAVIKELQDRDAGEILLSDLLDRLLVGPLQRPASEYVDLAVATEGISGHILSLLRRSPRRSRGHTEWATEWVSYSPRSTIALFSLCRIPSTTGYEYAVKVEYCEACRKARDSTLEEA